MRKGWFSRYQLLTVSNLADILVRSNGLLRFEGQCIRNIDKIANSRKRLPREPPLRVNSKWERNTKSRNDENGHMREKLSNENMVEFHHHMNTS